MTPAWSELFIAWNIPKTAGLSALQANLCEEFGATPRSECHVTLGHIGTCSESEFRYLLEVLQSHPLATLDHDFQVTGVGAAFRRRSYTLVADRFLGPMPSDEALVLWLSVEIGNSANALHQKLLAAVTRLGIRGHLLRERFDPHLTIGSRSKARASWDDYLVDKAITFRPSPLASIRWDYLYLADGYFEISKLVFSQ